MNSPHPLRALAIRFASRVLGALLQVVSQFIRDEVVIAVRNWWTKAQTTSNPNDDAFVKSLAKVLKINLSK